MKFDSHLPRLPRCGQASSDFAATLMRRSSSEHSTLPQLTLYWSHSCTPCYRIFGATKAVSSRCSSFWCFQLEIEPNTRLRGKRGSLCCMCVFLWWLPGLLIFLSSNYQFLQISSYFSLMIRFHYISGISSIIFGQKWSNYCSEFMVSPMSFRFHDIELTMCLAKPWHTQRNHRLQQ